MMRTVFGIALLLIIGTSLQAQELTSTKLRLIAPNGGESLKPGDTVHPVWTTGHPRFEDTIVLEHSTNWGWSWSELARKVSRDTTFRWIIPQGTTCSECQLRVRQVAGRIGVGDIVDSLPVLTTARQSDPRQAYVSTFDSLLTIRFDDSLHVYDFPRHEVVARLFLPDTSLHIHHIRFARHDTLLIAGTEPDLWEYNNYSRQTDLVYIWNLHTGELVHRIPGIPYQQVLTERYYSYRSADLHPDGRHVALGGYDRVRIWDLEESRIVDSLPMRWSRSVQYSPDGRYLAVGGLGSFVLWDFEERDTVVMHKGHYEQATFSPDGAWLLLIPSYATRNPDSATQGTLLLDVATGDTLFYRRGGMGIQFSQVGKRILEGSIRSLDPAFPSGYGNVSYSPFPGNPTFMGLTPSGSYAYACLPYQGRGVILDITRTPHDTLDKPFSISNDATIPVVINPFVGAVRMGESGDTLIDGFIHNGSTTPVEIIQARLAFGLNLGDFSITSGAGPYTLQPGVSASIGIRFSPPQEGTRLAYIEVETDRGKVVSQINGFGRPRVSDVSDAGNTAPELTMSVSPNPVEGKATIVWRNAKSGKLTLALYDLRGTLIEQIDLRGLESGVRELDKDRLGLDAGMYQLILRDDTRSVTEHLILMQ